MEKKTFPGIVTKTDEAQGIIETIFAVMGNIDHGKDRIWPGAFTKTFIEHGLKVRVLDHHNASSIMNVIGKPLFLEEIGVDQLPATLKAKYPEATGGARAEIKMLMDTPEGKGAFIRLKEKAIDEWSFGYDVLDSDFTKEKINGEDQTIRNLRTLRLFELSPVIWGMNSATTTTGAKSKEEKPYGIFEDEGQQCVFRVDTDGNQMGDSVGCHDTREEAEEQIQAILIEEQSSAHEDEEDEKGVSGKSGLSLAPREREWDNTAAESRVREWAGGEDNMDWTKYKQAHFWFDSENAEQFGGYKLLFGDIIGGELQAVPRGIFAVAGALQGAREGLDIPTDDQDKIKNKVSSYYSSMRTEFSDDTIIPPWDKSFTWETVQAKMVEYYKENELENPTDEDVGLALVYAFDCIMKEYTPMGPVQRMGEVLQGVIHKSFTIAADQFYIDGMLSTEERIALSGAIGDALNVLRAGIPLGVEERQVYYYGYCAFPIETESKAGRVLSRRNANRVTSAVVSLIEALDDAGIELEGFARIEEEEVPKDRITSDWGDLDYDIENWEQKYYEYTRRSKEIIAWASAQYKKKDKLEQDEAGPVTPPTYIKLLEIEKELTILAEET